jgi:hypothetical protein
MVESKLTVVARDSQESGGGQALVESIGERVADPGKIRLAGAVVEGKDKYHSSAGLCCRIGLG